MNKSMKRTMVYSLAAMINFSPLSFAQESGSAKQMSAPKIIRESIEWFEYRVLEAHRNAQPRVLLIGDSISGQYFPGVAEALKGKVYVSRLGSSKSVCLPDHFDEIKFVLSQHKYSVIHFNNGIHGKNYGDEEYRQGLEKLVQLLRTMAPDAKLIWASNTPLRAKPTYEEFGQYNDLMKARNQAAVEIMKPYGIPVNDLYSLMENHPEMTSDGTHYKKAGAELLAGQVAESILTALAGAPVDPGAKN